MYVLLSAFFQQQNYQNEEIEFMQFWTLRLYNPVSTYFRLLCKSKPLRYICTILYLQISENSAISSLNPLVAVGGVLVPDVVLQHEEQVEADGEDAEAQLGQVPSDGGPVAGVERDHDHLGNAQDTP